MMHQHLRLASAIAAAGFIFTSRPWLNWLNTLSPETGLLVKNMVIFLVIIGFHVVDQSVRPPHVQAIGFLLIYMAMTIVFNYQSQWIQDARAPEVEKQTPDGALYERARTTLGLSPDTARIITFVVAPFILVIIGAQLTRKSIRLDA